VDVGSADAEVLSQLFAALSIPQRQADSLVDALLDWRDRDDVARPLGAERDWYEAHGRLPPRNAPLADLRELARVRGFETLHGLDSVLTVEPGRIALNHAPLTVIAALPGLAAEAVAWVAEHRARGVPVTDLLALAGELSPAARRALLARYADLLRLTTVEPDAWVLTSRAKSGAPPVAAVLEVRLVRAGARAAIVRRRTWTS
jgi:general secretion pathway protein K